MTIDAVVFDIGGVLELTPGTGWERRWADELGLPCEEFQDRLGPLGAPGALGHESLEAIELQTAGEFGLDRDQLSRLTGEIWAEYLGTLNVVLAEHFAALRPRFRTGILSNSLVGARERQQAAYGLEDMCDVIVYSHEEGSAKPDPRSHGLVCARLGCEPQRTVFVDDNQLCVHDARTAGLHTIHFLSNEQAIPALDALFNAEPGRGGATSSQQRTRSPAD
jgi:FMN phosphatase YigB (HAD superfamily)